MSEIIKNENQKALDDLAMEEVSGGIVGKASEDAYNFWKDSILNVCQTVMLYEPYSDEGLIAKQLYDSLAPLPLNNNMEMLYYWLDLIEGMSPTLRNDLRMRLLYLGAEMKDYGK